MTKTTTHATKDGKSLCGVPVDGFSQRSISYRDPQAKEIVNCPECCIKLVTAV